MTVPTPTLNKAFTIVAKNDCNEKNLTTKLQRHIDVIDIEQRHEHVWKIACPNDTSLTLKIRQVFYQQQWDFALQDENPVPKKLFMSDMDATIVVGETIDEMGETLGLYEEISKITEAAMQGKLNYRTALKKRLSLLKGIPKKTIEDIAEQVTITKGADKLLDTLNQQGIESCLISGGFSTFTASVSKKLGFKSHLSNLLSYDKDDKLDGTWKGDLVTGNVKEATLRTLARQHSYHLNETIAIGDGANDMSMIKTAGLGVAYYAKPALREVAQAEIHSGTIDNLLWFLP
ncbi:MAG: phosphoserine phosphatase SerB [Gammaproteobacteria bacterium]|nr:phosphoserine phosphatase SerB [Gammaproteobacteria bacterium]